MSRSSSKNEQKREGNLRARGLDIWGGNGEPIEKRWKQTRLEECTNITIAIKRATFLPTYLYMSSQRASHGIDISFAPEFDVPVLLQRGQNYIHEPEGDEKDGDEGLRVLGTSQLPPIEPPVEEKGNETAHSKDGVDQHAVRQGPTGYAVPPTGLVPVVMIVHAGQDPRQPQSKEHVHCVTACHISHCSVSVRRF